MLIRETNPIELLPRSASESATMLLEAIQNGDLQVVDQLVVHGANLDGASTEEFLDETNTPLIAAIHSGNSEIVTQLLNLGADPGILSRIKQEDQWLIARSLIDNGFDATLLFQSLSGLKPVGTRLLYVLQDGGADIYSNRPTSNQGPDLSLRLSDYEVGCMHNMRVRTRQMISAIQRSDLECVDAEILHGADPTFGIETALSRRDLKTLRVLLLERADLRYLKFRKNHASFQDLIAADACLIMVAEEPFTSALDVILRMRDPSKTIEGREGEVLLRRLIQRNDLLTLKMLLGQGVFSRHSVTDSSSWSLQEAAKSSKEMFGLLLNFGAVIPTALAAAVVANNHSNLENLLECLVYHDQMYHIKTLWNDGMTMLLFVIREDALLGARLLMQYSAHYNVKPKTFAEIGNTFAIATENEVVKAPEPLRPMGSYHDGVALTRK